MKTKKVKKLAPAALETLAKGYLRYDNEIKDAQAEQDKIWLQLVDQVRDHGALAPKADKTRRVESAEHFIDVTFGQSFEILDQAVEKFWQKCKTPSEARLFHLLFEARKKYVKVPGADKEILTASAAFRRRFLQCFSPKDVAPRLSVKAKEEK